MKNINYGIDLGTTNSGIAKFEDGKVIILKNPVGFSETLPSVVAFRKDRIFIGEKARELMKNANTDVFSSFKRKMGTEHQYQISNSEETKTPIELSSMILKELLSFVTNEKPESIVITIPASFDTVQSNATKKAGELTGFQQAVLLQEPIAACLAYANFQNIEHKEEKNWLVYDFGGGTFDAALVKINERELKIIDHEGNNFLGGVDLDHLVIEHLLVPQLEKVLNEENLFKKIMSKSENSYAKLYFELLYKAEEIKKELSLKETVVSEMEINDGEHYIDFQVSRGEFNKIIHEKVEESISLIKKLLDENQKIPQDIERIILVGGTTYIPYIRERLVEEFGISVDNSIDPTTAVMVGAAYFAGTKEDTSNLDEKIEEKNVETTSNKIQIKLLYEINTQDEEELLVGVADENFNGFYRILRKDGGFDTGLMSFKTKFSEFVKILPKQKNSFKVMVFDENQNQVFEKEGVDINHGIYNISGQPLPNDICLEVDDNFGSTYLEKIFKRNDILPLTKTIYKTTSKNFDKESNDKLIINILEGRTGTLPSSNISIGYLEINASEMPINLLKVMDIELKFNMSESRDLSVSVYVSSIDFEKKEIFNPHTKKVNKAKFQEDIDRIIDDIESELSFQIDDFDEIPSEELKLMAQFKTIKDELYKIKMDLIEVEEDGTTEEIFQLDERKRRAMQSYDKMVRFRDVMYEIEEYNNEKKAVEDTLDEASPRQIEHFKKIIKDEKIFLESNEKALIKRKTQELEKLWRDIYYKKDEAYASVYYHYKYKNLSEYSQPKKAAKLIEAGDQAMENENYKEIRYIINEMYNLLKVKPKDPFEDKDGNLGLK